MENISRRRALALLPVAGAAMAAPVAGIVRDPLLDVLGERKIADAIFNDPSVEEEGAEWNRAEAITQSVYERLRKWGPAVTAQGAIAALECALSEILVGPGKVEPAMIRSAIGYLRTLPGGANV